MGNYHGKYGFDTFSHLRTTMIRYQGFEFLNKLRYPPYKYAKVLITLMQNRSLPKWLKFIFKVLGSKRFLVSIICVLVSLLNK
jgi:hypothetical protein